MKGLKDTAPSCTQELQQEIRDLRADPPVYVTRIAFGYVCKLLEFIVAHRLDELHSTAEFGFVLFSTN